MRGWWWVMTMRCGDAIGCTGRCMYRYAVVRSVRIPPAGLHWPAVNVPLFAVMPSPLAIRPAHPGNAHLLNGNWMASTDAFLGRLGQFQFAAPCKLYCSRVIV